MQEVLRFASNTSNKAKMTGRLKLNGENNIAVRKIIREQPSERIIIMLLQYLTKLTWSFF